MCSLRRGCLSGHLAAEILREEQSGCQLGVAEVKEGEHPSTGVVQRASAAWKFLTAPSALQ